MTDLAALLFTCERHPGGLRLLPSACAAQFQRAKGANPWDWLYRCQGCEIGASHAGEAPPEPPDASRFRCCWCGNRPGRLIWRGTVCPSCANRVFEIARATGRRGKAPMNFELGVYIVEAPDEVVDNFGPKPGSRHQDLSEIDRR